MILLNLKLHYLYLRRHLHQVHLELLENLHRQNHRRHQLRHLENQKELKYHLDYLEVEKLEEYYLNRQYH